MSGAKVVVGVQPRRGRIHGEGVGGRYSQPDEQQGGEVEEHVSGEQQLPTGGREQMERLRQPPAKYGEATSCKE